MAESFGRHSCGGILWTAEIEFEGVILNGHRCDKCGEESAHGSEFAKVEAAERATEK